MDSSSLEKQVNVIEARVAKLRSQLRLTLVVLLGVIVIMACAGAFAFGSLFTEMRLQKQTIAQQQTAIEHALADGMPPGQPPQPGQGQDEDP